MTPWCFVLVFFLLAGAQGRWSGNIPAIHLLPRLAGGLAPSSGATLSQIERWWVRTGRTDLVLFLAQDSSYWAIKLPHGWWVFGLDNALQEDIDTLQVMYVCLCKCAMLTGEVLCTPPPPFSTNTLHSLLLQWTQMTAS